MPEPSKYRIVITAFKVGDPTIKIGLRLPEGEGTIENLHIQATLTYEETVLAIDTTIPSFSTEEPLYLLSCFSGTESMPSGNVAGELILTTPNEDTFEVVSEEGVPPFNSHKGNYFTTASVPIIPNNELPNENVLVPGTLLAVQCVDLQGQKAFLKGNFNTGATSLTSIFNPYLNNGMVWQIETSSHEGMHYLKCINKEEGADQYLYGQNNGTPVIVVPQSNTTQQSWNFESNPNGNNLYGIINHGNIALKVLEGNTVEGATSLYQSYETENKSVNWYLHKL